MATSPWPVMTRWWIARVHWWRAREARTQIALGLAGLFALASMLNLAGATVGRLATTSRAPVPTAASAAPAPNLIAETQPADAGRSWTVRGLWQGTGSRETEAFVVKDHWRVDWLFSPAPTGGSLHVFIYHADGRLLNPLLP